MCNKTALHGISIAIGDKNNMGELRKIKFSLAVPGLSMMDYDVDNLEVGAEKMKERNGFFHCFGNRSTWDAENS